MLIIPDEGYSRSVVRTKFDIYVFISKQEISSNTFDMNL